MSQDVAWFPAGPDRTPSRAARPAFHHGRRLQARCAEELGIPGFWCCTLQALSDSYGKQPAMFFRQIGADGQSDASVAALAQILGPETAELRTALARTLETSKNPAASKVLARSAIFDPSGDVRIAAVNALKRRPNDEHTRYLDAGMQHIRCRSSPARPRWRSPSLKRTDSVAPTSPTSSPNRRPAIRS